MNIEEFFKIVSLSVGSLFLPFLFLYILFKEYIKGKAEYVFLFVLFIAFCINFFIFHIGDVIGTISLMAPILLIFIVFIAFITCKVSDKKTLLNKFNILIFSLLLLFFLTCPILLCAEANEKFKYNHLAKIKTKKVAAAICVVPIIKAEIYTKLYDDTINYDEDEAIKNYELAYKYDKNLNINLTHIYLRYKQYEKAENLARKTNFEYGFIKALLAQGKAKEAEEAARTAESTAMLIKILLSQGRNNEALEIAKEKLGENSQTRSVHVDFIEIYLAMNDYENAQKHVKMALDIPYDGKIFTMNSEPFYAYQSIIYAKKGDIANAKKEYKKINYNLDNVFEEYNIDVNLLKDE